MKKGIATLTCLTFALGLYCLAPINNPPGATGSTGAAGSPGTPGISGSPGPQGSPGAIATPTPGVNPTAILGVACTTGGGVVFFPAMGTQYVSPSFDMSAAILTGTGAETDAQFVMPYGGTLKKLNVRTGDTTKVATPVTIITVRKNGTDTTVTLTLTQTENTTSSDSTHSVVFSAGDILTISITTTGPGSQSTGITSMSMEFD